MQSKAWTGRFTQPTDAFVEAFTASIEFDQQLYAYDIQGSIAHAKMLRHCQILTEQESQQIIQGLQRIQAQIEQQQFDYSIRLEDIHMNIEAKLTQTIGEVGKKLHTGRSRNDQVATDVRLYLRHEIKMIEQQLAKTQFALLQLASEHTDTIMPGFTHLQVAQPITFGHHLMAWFEMLYRDRQRLTEAYQRCNTSPLGAAALAGTSFAIDRHYSAKLLGFKNVCENSLDAVSDRDFIIEFQSHMAILIMHLSRFSEELIIWSSAQFDFIDIADSFTTGSSIMPQKKNPDVPELIRGKTGRIFGHLFALLSLMKSQPLAYNKDNQEDKEPLFDTVAQIKGCLKVFAEMLPTITVKKQRMYQATKQGFATATDLADYLVKHGLAFRDAHEIVGKAVRYGINQNKDLAEMSLAELQEFSEIIQKDVFKVLTLEGSIQARDHFGGTAPNQVKAAIDRAYERLQKFKE